MGLWGYTMQKIEKRLRRNWETVAAHALVAVHAIAAIVETVTVQVAAFTRGIDNAHSKVGQK